MARGGARKGAGRKQGAANKATQEAIAAAKATGELPLDYMLRIMRDAQAEDRRRDAMAAAAAQYLHPKLAAVEHTGKDGRAIEVDVIKRVIVGARDSDGGGVPPALGAR